MHNMAESISQWDYFVDEDSSTSNMYVEWIIKSGHQW